MRRWRLAALGLVSVLMTAACGLRAPAQDVRAARRAAVGNGSGSGSASSAGTDAVSAGTSGGGGADTATPDAAGGASAGSSGAAAGAVAGSGNGGPAAPASAGGNGPAAPLPSGGNGGATDIGVTATSITVGNISDLGGPVPGLFQGGPYGTKAYFDYINSQGGVYGRKLQLKVNDDQLDCTQNQADYQNMVDEVFAFVGSWSLDDSCGAQVLAAHPVPAIQQALSVQFQKLPGSFSINPYNAGAPTGYFEYFKAKYPDAIKSVGTLVGNQASAVQSWKYFKATMESLGYVIKYEDDFPPAQSNFTADVIRMRQQGIKMVFILAVNAPDLAIFSQEAYQQGWKPDVFVAPIGYFGSYVSEAGGAAAVEDQWVPVVQAMFLGEDAASVPEVALFDKWIKQDFPTFPLDQFANTSWADGALFVEALKKAGPQITRAKLVAALSQIHSYGGNGMFPAIDVAAKKNGNCYLLLRIHNGKYVKVDDPPTGFRCDGTYHYVS
jgi:ABC-type branched-subunit amino acid transport system substrate-binding protein